MLKHGILKASAARQNVYPFARFEAQTRLVYSDETIPSNHGADIARAFPEHQFDVRLAVRPADAGGKIVCHAGFFVDGVAEPGFEKRQGLRLIAGEQLDHRDGEQLKRNHRGDGISRESQNRLAFAPAEHGGLSRA